MRYVLPFCLLVIGLIVGYFVGANSILSKKYNLSTTDLVTTKIIYDTIFTEKIVKVPFEIEDKLTEIDSLGKDSIVSIEVEDTLAELFSVAIIDTLTDDGVKINIDKRIASMKLNIVYLNNQIVSDSLLKSALNITDIQNRKIIIEFWESPINYTGYKLSKSKLIVYGLSPQFEYNIYKNGAFYYLNFQSIFYKMMETNQFLPYLLIEEFEVLND
jgi:hypothetical protein